MRMRQFMRMNCTIIFFIAALLANNTVAAPVSPPEMQAHALSTAPFIDGVVRGDAAWDGVVPARDFWQVRPNDGEAATQATEVFIGFTESALYIGVVAYDENPDGIIVMRHNGIAGSKSNDEQNNLIIHSHKLSHQY